MTADSQHFHSLVRGVSMILSISPEKVERCIRHTSFHEGITTEKTVRVILDYIRYSTPSRYLTLEDYTSKSIVVRFKDEVPDDVVEGLYLDLVELGGLWNENLKGGEGMIFPKFKERKIRWFLITHHRKREGWNSPFLNYDVWLKKYLESWKYLPINSTKLISGKLFKRSLRELPKYMKIPLDDTIFKRLEIVLDDRLYSTLELRHILRGERYSNDISDNFLDSTYEEYSPQLRIMYRITRGKSWQIHQLQKELERLGPEVRITDRKVISENEIILFSEFDFMSK